MTTATARKPRGRKKAAPKPPPTQILAPVAVAKFHLTAADSDRFAKACRTVGSFTSTDDVHMVLTALHVVSDGEGTVTVEGTDSRRLARITLPKMMTYVDESPPKFDVLVPSKWFVTNLPKRSRFVGFGLEFTDEAATIHAYGEERSATAKLVQGPWPNTSRFVDGEDPGPDGLAGETGFNPQLLSGVLRAAHGWGDAVRVRSLDPLKQVRFDVDSADGQLIALLMPIGLS